MVFDEAICKRRWVKGSSMAVGCRRVKGGSRLDKCSV